MWTIFPGRISIGNFISLAIFWSWSFVICLTLHFFLTNWSYSCWLDGIHAWKSAQTSALPIVLVTKNSWSRFWCSFWTSWSSISCNHCSTIVFILMASVTAPIHHVCSLEAASRQLIPHIRVQMEMESSERIWCCFWSHRVWATSPVVRRLLHIPNSNPPVLLKIYPFWRIIRWFWSCYCPAVNRISIMLCRGSNISGCLVTILVPPSKRNIEIAGCCAFCGWRLRHHVQGDKELDLPHLVVGFLG